MSHNEYRGEHDCNYVPPHDHHQPHGQCPPIVPYPTDQCGPPPNLYPPEEHCSPKEHCCPPPKPCPTPVEYPRVTDTHIFGPTPFPTKYDPNIQPAHGWVVDPPSRVQNLMNLRLLATWPGNEMESGKMFPDLNAGGRLPPPWHEDVASSAPPPDRFISSAGHTDAGRNRANFTDQEMAQFLGVPNYQWPRIYVIPGQVFRVNWFYSQGHTTRGYRWFITRNGWNPAERLTRAQLEPVPFYQDFSSVTPYWGNASRLQPLLEHEAVLPFDKQGYHQILMIWMVADTARGFYQTFDVEFSGGGGGGGGVTPPPGVPEWNPNGVLYRVNDFVMFNNRRWRCFNEHISTPELWPGRSGTPWIGPLA